MCLLDEDGRVNCYGGYSSLLPDNSRFAATSYLPAVLDPVTAFATKFALDYPPKVCAIGLGGTIACWPGTLGRDFRGDFERSNPFAAPPQLTGVTEAWITGAQFRISGFPESFDLSCARVAGDPRLRCWGLEWLRSAEERSRGFSVPDTEDVAEIAHSCVRRRRGDVACFDQSTRSVRSVLPFSDVTRLRAFGSYCVCASRRNGEVWCWGTEDLCNTPTQLDAPAQEWRFGNRAVTIEPTRFAVLEPVVDDY